MDDYGVRRRYGQYRRIGAHGSFCRSTGNLLRRLARDGDELAAGLGLGPSKGVLHVLVGRGLADPKSRGDLPVSGALRDQVDDLMLARCQTRGRLAPRE